MNKVLRRAFLAVVIALPVLVALTVGVAAVNRFAGPLPPRTFSMSTGREGGAYHQFALEYRRLLARQGFTLVIEPGPGSVETVRRLRRGEVTVGFVQGGTAADSDAEQLVSLASVFYEPLWIFHRRALRVTSLGELRGRRVAAGEEGSGTRALALQLLAASQVTPQNTDVLALTNDDAEARLRDGRIDAALFVISPREPILPFWVAGIVDRLFIILLPVVTVLVPITIVSAALFDRHVRRRIGRWYRTLRDLERRLETSSPDDLDREIERLHVVERQITRRTRLPLEYMKQFYDLKVHIDLIRARLEQQSRTGRASSGADGAGPTDAPARTPRRLAAP